MSTKAWRPRSVRWTVIVAVFTLTIVSAHAIFRNDRTSKPLFDADLFEHESDIAENTDYWLRQRGLQFGLPHDAYAHAVSRMRVMAAQRPKGHSGGAAATAATPAW